MTKHKRNSSLTKVFSFEIVSYSLLIRKSIPKHTKKVWWLSEWLSRVQCWACLKTLENSGTRIKHTHTSLLLSNNHKFWTKEEEKRIRQPYFGQTVPMTAWVPWSIDPRYQCAKINYWGLSIFSWIKLFLLCSNLLKLWTKEHFGQTYWEETLWMYPKISLFSFLSFLTMKNRFCILESPAP